MEAAERTLPKDDHKERHDVLQVLPIASLFTYTLYSFDFDNYSPTNSSIPSKPFSHNLLKFIKYIKTMMVSQEIFAHDSIDSMERKKRKLVNNFFIATEKAHSSKQHGTFVQLAAMRKFSQDGDEMYVYYSSFLDKDKDADSYKPDCTVKCREMWGDSSAGIN